jgi:uncharacterized membrane protein required for colicin V production
MVLGLFTVIIMGVVAYAFWREGPLTAFAMCVNVVLAGLLAFNFFEPIADLLDSSFEDTFADGTQDALAMMLIFLPVLALLRFITNSIANTHMEYPPILYRGGAVVFGLVTGYLVSGFLVCVLQTLPLQQNFLSFEVDEPGKSHPLRKVLPPDVVWLAMMHRVSDDRRLGWEGQFDPNCNFELRYLRYRRFDESGTPLKWRGELQAGNKEQ